MKKLIFFIFCILSSLCCIAENIDSKDAITLVSYEQNWSDYEGTLALKNNTSSTVHNVTFRINYLNMSGKPLDYEDFTENIEIAPGKTRKINIPANTPTINPRPFMAMIIGSKFNSN